jgi:murein DD-endopeptidase MepM/ murein hydrolase activator NlpD
MTTNSNIPSGSLPEDELQTLEPEETKVEKKSISASQLWSRLLHFGLGEPALRIGTAIASIILVALVIWVMSKFFLKAEKNAPIPTASIEEVSPTSVLPINGIPSPILASSISVFRLAQLHTILPPKPRTDVIDYTIVEGDTLFGIAEKYGLQPESLLWSNKHILGDNPDNLKPGVKILIPPFDGVIHQWIAGEGLNGVSNGLKVTPDVIVDWPGNHLNRETLGDFSLPNIAEGTLLFVPNGKGEFTDWLPTFTRETAAIASSLGPGFCGAITEGPIGDGTFIWPAPTTWISGYDYSPGSNHRGIDIGGVVGDVIKSVDAGVVVYSGWNNNGYGNLIIVDHGNGWQSVYAHLDQLLKGCADYVYKGEQIATMGNTGNSSGPHLHFELRNETFGTVNPHDFLQQ